MIKEKKYVKKPKGGKALFFDIPSRTTPGKMYKVRVMPDGEVRCACTANVMGNMCLHIGAFLKLYNQDKEKLMGDIVTEDLEELKEEREERDEKKKTAEKVVEPIKESRGFGADFPF